MGVCISSSHLHTISSSHHLIFTPSHLHIFSSSHLLIFTSSHLHIFSSSHLLIFTSSHLHIFSSSHLLIFTSSHFTSSHLHIFSSSHPHIFTSSHLHLLLQLCGSGCVCHPAFSIIGLKNNSKHLKPGESFVYIGEEFRFHDSSRFRKKAGDAKLPLPQFCAYQCIGET